MEGTKRRAANSLGMFDLLKGVGMLTIVFAHTGELYPMGDASHINPLTFFMFAYRESLMAAFYIASGYGFRKRSIGKCIDQQFKTLLKPYIYTGIATTVFHFIIHYSLFGSLHNATYETYKVLGGFALGLPHTATYFGQLFFSCGPMWYLLSLMIAWILLDLILNIFPEQYINWAVLGTMLLGWGICITWEAPFCIGQGMVTVPALYVGYLAKKYKIFDQPPLAPSARRDDRGGAGCGRTGASYQEHRLRLDGRVDPRPREHPAGCRDGPGHPFHRHLVPAQGGERCHPRHPGHWPPFAVHLLRPHCGAHGHSLVPDAPEVLRLTRCWAWCCSSPFRWASTLLISRAAGAPPDLKFWLTSAGSRGGGAPAGAAPAPKRRASFAAKH